MIFDKLRKTQQEEIIIFYFFWVNCIIHDNENGPKIMKQIPLTY